MVSNVANDIQAVLKKVPDEDGEPGYNYEVVDRRDIPKETVLSIEDQYGRRFTISIQEG